MADLHMLAITGGRFDVIESRGGTPDARDRPDHWTSSVAFIVG